jgi:arginase
MAASSAIDITYVPADCGSVIYGKSKAPAAFKSVGLASKLSEAGQRQVVEHEALQAPAIWQRTGFRHGGVRNEDLNVEVCTKVHDALQANLARQNATLPFQLIIGGECCMLPGIMKAFWGHYDGLGKRVALVYIDADTDLNTPSDAKSTGTLASQSMTHLIGAPSGLQSMKDFARKDGRPLCDASNTIFFGLNMSFAGNKPEHFAYLYDKQYRVIPSSAVAENPKTQAAAALEYLEDQSVDAIFVHLDVDSIDPGEFPLANMPNWTGVRFETMMEALAVLLSHTKIIGLCVAEVNPDHDPGLLMTKMLTSRIVEMSKSRI